MLVEPAFRLTHSAALQMLNAAVKKAEEMGQPQCIVIVDASGVSIAQIRMNGSKYLSLLSATAKARTAASIGAPSNNIPEDFGALIASATGGEVTRLPGGLPIVVNGELVGGIGVGSGSGEQDIEVGNAALSVLA